eukprot:scaffold2045_cov404-Prasinococcus_capsulatus_cf.AAC.13
MGAPPLKPSSWKKSRKTRKCKGSELRRVPSTSKRTPPSRPLLHNSNVAPARSAGVDATVAEGMQPRGGVLTGALRACTGRVAVSLVGTTAVAPARAPRAAASMVPCPVELALCDRRTGRAAHNVPAQSTVPGPDRQERRTLGHPGLEAPSFRDAQARLRSARPPLAAQP